MRFCLMLNLASAKAHGHDKINNECSKYVAHQHVTPSKYFQIMFRMGNFSTEMEKQMLHFIKKVANSL